MFVVVLEAQPLGDEHTFRAAAESQRTASLAFALGVQCLALIHLLSVIVTSRSTEWQFSDTGGWLVPEGAYRELDHSPSPSHGRETL